jgi:hypothetical protein
MTDHLIAIHPEPGHPITSVRPDEVEARNADGWGIYWHVNVTRKGLTTKATKADIIAIRYAHVDIDPPKPPAVWDRSAVLADLLSQRPTRVIDSGNGLQGLWALVPGATVEQVELVNRGLIQRFNADKGTWNVDRVFRLPDTINWPNAIKRAAGREPVMASILHQSDAVYEVGALLAAWPYVAPVARAGADEIDPIAYEVIPLPERASMGTVELVMHPAGADRSVDVSRAVTAMARDGLTDAEIMGVILNPALPISAHCLDQGDPERAARRKCSLAAAHRFDPERAFGDPVDMPVGVLPEPPVVTRARVGGYGSRAVSGFMGIADQMDHFQGCVYIMHSDRVLMPDGVELNLSRFDVMRGGHLFAMDDVNDKNTKSAWEAFLKNSAYSPPTAHNTCFRPEVEPFAIVEDGTWRLVNTYQPIDTPRTKGDAGPFLRHMETLFPDDRDRSILMSYMASLVQNPGVKFQWWPVIQGAKGNGKTLLLNILTYCVGEQYSHLPNTSKMTRNGISFNGWLKGKLFLGMDEVYSAQRRDFLEEFKPYVTNRRLPIESKGVDEYTGDNRANGMMLTNHKDGVPVDKDERRYAVFFTKQQTAEDCFRDGLTPEHFQKFWAWLDADGFAIVNDYLRSYVPAPEFDPAQRASRAPRTSSTDHAIEASRGRAEAEIMDAVEEGRMGFKGGYISSRMVSKLMEEKRIPLPRNKFKSTLDGLDYIPHPSLPEGKTPSVVPPDGARTILYVRRREPYVTENIADDYSTKQLGA